MPCEHADMKIVVVLNTSIHEGEDTVVVSEESDVVPVDLDITVRFSLGRLPNSKILTNLDVHLSYLDSPKRSDSAELIDKHPALFSDVPTCTNVLQHRCR